MTVDTEISRFYDGKQILITGGLGFIGTNIIRDLVKRGAHITVLDYAYPAVPGGMPAREDFELVVADLRDEAKIEQAVRDKDIIFNLAGKSGAADSNKTPHNDLAINCTGHLTLLEACRKFNRGVTILFPSSRLVYGKPRYLPVDEKHPLAPESIYAAHKLAGENYHIIYGKLYGLKATVLRISNPYGPFQRDDARAYGLANIFIQSAAKGGQLTIFGDGEQKRDYIYIDDLVQAFLLAGVKPESRGKIYNIGDSNSVSIRDLATMAVEISGRGTIVHVPWPDESGAIETGDYQSNIGLAKSELGWRPSTDLKTGVQMTLEFYRRQISY